MKLKEVATQIRLVDGDRPYYYWVTVTRDPIRAAIKKHRAHVGSMTTSDDDLRANASVVDQSAKKEKEEKEELVS